MNKRKQYIFKQMQCTTGICSRDVTVTFYNKVKKCVINFHAVEWKNNIGSLIEKRLTLKKSEVTEEEYREACIFATQNACDEWLHIYTLNLQNDNRAVKVY